jgi:hypothetical protein
MPPHRPDRTQILAFRLDSHHLTHRLPLEAIQTASGVCGVQNTPPGSALISLHARLTGLAPAHLDQALTQSRNLLQAWSLRASPHIFPTRDHPVFTLGLLPEKEDDLRSFILGVETGLQKLDLPAVKLVSLGAAALPSILDGRSLTKDEIGVALAERVAPSLSPPQRAIWASTSWITSSQTFGESVMRFILPVLSLQGLCCHGERQGNQATIRRPVEWLAGAETGACPGAMPRDEARAGLVRRFLHAYGPSTPRHFAEWAGISLSQAEQSWTIVQEELVEVETLAASGSRTRPGSSPAGNPVTWLHHADVSRFEAPPQPGGVRFLPAHDPYLQQRDRLTLIPDKTIHRQVWRTSGSPGVILYNGQAVGTWSAKVAGWRLVLSIRLFEGSNASFPGPHPPSPSADLDAEAAALAKIKGCTKAEIYYATHA